MKENLTLFLNNQTCPFIGMRSIRGRAVWLQYTPSTAASQTPSAGSLAFVQCVPHSHKCSEPDGTPHTVF